jgi:hypothetical protein
MSADLIATSIPIIYPINNIPRGIVITQVAIHDTNLPTASADYEEIIVKNFYVLVLKELKTYHDNQIQRKQQEHEQLVNAIQYKYSICC